MNLIDYAIDSVRVATTKLEAAANETAAIQATALATASAALAASPPTFAIIAPAAAAEGNSGAKLFIFVATLSKSWTSPIAVAWSTAGTGTNAADSTDFTGGVFPSGTFAFAAGETSKNIVVSVNGDTAVEPNENFLLTATPTLQLSTVTATGTILNDDFNTAPDAPVLSAVAGDGRVTLSWTDGSTGGAAITGHPLYAGTSAGALALVGTITTGSPYVDTGLTNGTTRYYAVSALNTVGESARSNIVNATPVASVALVPTTYPAISGSLTDGSTLTATPSTWPGSPTVTRQWYRDGVAISGATGNTYTYRSATDDGCYIQCIDTANGTVNAPSNAVILPLRSLVSSTTFAGAADGTPLAGYGGWTRVVNALGGNPLQIIGGALVATAISGNDLWQHATAGPDHELETYIDYTVGSSDSTGALRLMRLRYTNGANCIQVDMDSHGFTPQKVVGGTGTALCGFINFGTLANGTKMRFAISNGYMRIYANDVELSQSASANGGLGLDVRDVPAANFVAIGGAQATSSTAYPRPITHAINIYDNHITAVAVVSVVNATDPYATTGQISATIAGTFTGTIAQQQYAVVTSAGAVAVPWTNFSGQSGQTYSFTAALPAGIVGQVTVLVRDAANHSSFGTALFTVPARQSISTLRVGQQDGNYSYYSASDYSRDNGRRLDVRYNGYSNTAQQTAGGLGGYDANGFLNSYPSGFSSYLFVLPFYWAKLGTYTVKYPAGMTASGDSLGSIGLGAEYSIDANTVGRKLTITQRYQGNGAIVFSGVPTGKTATTLGLRPSITFDQDGSPASFLTDEVVSSFAALNAKIFRTMDARRINNDTSQHTIGNSQNYFGMSLGMIVEWCNKTNTDLWLNFWTNQDDAYVRAECDYVAANLKARLKFHTEYSNETWNGQFQQTEECTHLGIQAGLTIATSSAAAAPISNYYRLGGNFTDPTTPIPTRAFATGDTVGGNKYGLGITVWRALQAITANDANAALPSATNAYWQVLYSNAQTSAARIRWCSKRGAAIANIAQAAYTAIGRDTSTIIPEYAYWAIQPVGGDGAIALDFDNNYLVYKGYDIAPYWGGGVGGYNMSSYTSGDFGTWTSAQKQLYLTDIPSCVNAFYANAPTAITASVKTARDRKNELAGYLAGKGVSVDSIPLRSYEFGSHCQFNSSTGWTNGTQVNALNTAITNDPRSGTMLASYLTQYRQIVGGDACWYGRLGLPAPWNSQNDELDRSSVLMAALMANS